MLTLGVASSGERGLLLLLNEWRVAWFRACGGKNVSTCFLFSSLLWEFFSEASPRGVSVCLHTFTLQSKRPMSLETKKNKNNKKRFNSFVVHVFSPFVLFLLPSSQRRAFSSFPPPRHRTASDAATAAASSIHHHPRHHHLQSSASLSRPLRF